MVLGLDVSGAVSAELTPKLAKMKTFQTTGVSGAAFRSFSEVSGRNNLYRVFIMDVFG